ncbi:unnamed protein product [Blepharisma stoltei]|uniref:sphingomyelin phosphodiesterase n=1 Tax=Blepharisma stoltei TaxID=1481888 RepID=A0AAU9K862_9CILI|nr:unnamed protein product [Blepharisma stoltei]
MERTNDQSLYPNVSLLSLNLFLRPPVIKTNISDYKSARARYFLDNIISKYEIVCLQEVFTSFSSRRKKIKKEAYRKGFKDFAESPNPGWFGRHLTDGGLLILSKYPIVQKDFFGFSRSKMPDTLSLKGVLYAKLQINDKFVHLFTAHLQSSYPTSDYHKFLKYREIRRSQIKEMREFMDRKIESSNELVILVGDFNVNGREEIKPPKFKDQECQDDYSCFINEISKGGKEEILDVLRMKFGYTPATYGRVDRNGNAIETVLSEKDETMSDEGLDHIFFCNIEKSIENDYKVHINMERTLVEPFYTPNQPFTQISDHAAVQTSFTWLKNNMS